MTSTSKRRPSCTMRFLATIVECDPLPAHVIASRSGLSVKQCTRIASKLVSTGRISRIKPKISDGGGCYRYFMSDDQLRRMRSASFDGLKGMGAMDAVDRLRFLRRLKDLPAFRGAAVLDAIIGDYQRALRASSEGEQP